MGNLEPRSTLPAGWRCDRAQDADLAAGKPLKQCGGFIGGAAVYSARSDAVRAILVPDGVTRWWKTSPAASRSLSGRPPRTRSTWVRAIVWAPPRFSSVCRRSFLEPLDNSVSQSLFMTSCK